MLIFCCGMNRAGSTLQYQIAAEIVESHNLGIALGWIDTPNQETLKTLDNIACRSDKLAVVKCHTYTLEAAAYISAGKAKGIYIYRDLRDVIVSLGRKFFDSVDAAIAYDCINELLENYYGWIALKQVLISQYEITVNNLGKEIENIAAFLKVKLSPSEILQMSETFSLEQQKTKIASLNFSQDCIENFNERNPELDFYDPKSQLHNQHIHSGLEGQWRTELQPSQISMIENIAYSWLIDRQYALSTIAFDGSKTGEEYFHLARTQVRNGNYAAAIDNFQQAINLLPHEPSYHFQLGQAFFKLECYGHGINAYRHAININPKLALYYAHLGMALEENQQFERAIEAYQGAIRLEPNTAQFYSSVANAFLKIEQPCKAVDYLNKVISLNNN